MQWGDEFPLWEGEPPFFRPEDRDLAEHFMERRDGVRTLTDVTIPTLTWYPATWGGTPNPRPAVMVAPGGAYRFLSWNLEGTDICGMLNRNGFDAFLLKYRCPDRRRDARADGARAMRCIRARAAESGIDPRKVGAIGFSAGANLCAAISAPADENFYPVTDAVDKFDFRPDFTALIYPWELANPDLSLREPYRIDVRTPPALLIQAEDDFADPETSVAWFLAMKRQGRPVEMHIWPSGGHGYGLTRPGNPTDDWDLLAGTWFRRQL